MVVLVFSSQRHGAKMPKAHNRQDGKREPNGQLSRKQKDMIERAFAGFQKDEREMMEVGLSARERVHGLPRAVMVENKPVAVSRDQMAGSAIGRLYLTREISYAQYEAATRWLDGYVDYAKTIPSPAQPTAMDIGRVHGRTNREENIDKSIRAKELHKAAQDAVLAAQYEVSGKMGSRFALLHTLWVIVQNDQERFDMVPDLRVALNALVRHYKLEKVEGKAA